MAWIVMTEKMAIARATTIETNANSAVGADGESPLMMNLRGAVAQVRQAIAQGGKTRLDPAEMSVPASLVDTVLSIAIFNFASRVLAQPIVVQDARYQQYSRAMEDLERLRKGEIYAEDPDTGVVSNGSAAVSVVSSRCDRFSRREFAGL